MQSWFGSAMTPSQRPRKPSTSSSSCHQFQKVPQPGTMDAAAYTSIAIRMRRGVVTVFTTAVKKRKCLATSRAPDTDSARSMDQLGESSAAPQ